MIGSRKEEQAYKLRKVTDRMKGVVSYNIKVVER